MKKKVVTIFIVTVIITAISVIYLKFNNFDKNTNYYTGTINSNVAILGEKPSKDGLVLSIFELQSNTVNKQLIKYKSASEKDLVTSIQGKSEYFLIQSIQDSITDKILDVQKKTVIDIGWRGTSVVSENESSILLTKYTNDAWQLSLFDKNTGTIKNTSFSEKFMDAGGVRVHHGIFSSATGKWYIPFSCNQGTFIILLSDGGFSKLKISDNELTDLWMLNASDNDIQFYSGFQGSTDANSIQLMNPKFYEYTIKDNKNLVIKKSIDFDIKELGDGSNCIGFYQKSENEYLLLYRTQGNSKLRTVLMNINNKDIKIKATSSPINIECTKISNSLIAVSGYEKAIFINDDGNIKSEKVLK